ncbi:hypothetical protein GBF35_29700 [Nonomuraea phyllanthi]|uniref:FAD-dependent oxidoreductase n=1 Tax=Nonomuraea phyllanthi TaxID=2219224 RepID=UPI0012940B4A|nr:FAD-dependent monooxygenase [Nonomuraea phyllanthi]QFY10250.1 hypothetical protein GBF35_29700 [Nonomuraea phyllanthi]
MVTEFCWVSELRIHRRPADAYGNGRILIAGDVAHIQSLFSDQGQNTGLGSAENLAGEVALAALGRAACRLLDTNEGERRPLAQKVLSATSTAVDIMLPSTRGKRLVRDKIVLPVLRLPLSSASCGWPPPNSAWAAPVPSCRWKVGSNAGRCSAA